MTDMTIEQVIGAMTRILDSTENVGIRVDRAKISKWRDAIDAHLAKAAQTVEAVDIGVGRDIVKRLRDTPNWLKEAWGDFKSAGANKYDRAPKEAADYIETLLAALAHPSPRGDAKVLTTQAILARIDAVARQADGAMQSNDEKHLRNTLEIIADELTAIIAAERVHVPTGEQAGEVAWAKKAADFIEKKAQSYADEFGRDDMGSISFGAGRGADKMEEYWMSLIDLAEDFRKLGGKCQVPPDGWECSRAVGHDGPCAASPAAAPDGEVG